MTKSARRLAHQRLLAAAYIYAREPKDLLAKGVILGMLAVYECSDHSTAAQRNRNLKRVMGELKEAIGHQELTNLLNAMYEDWPDLTLAWDRIASVVHAEELKRERQSNKSAS